MKSLGSFTIECGPKMQDVIDLPVYSVTKHRGFVPSLEYFKKQVFSRELRGYRIVESGDFAYATIHLDEGSIGIAPERCLVSPMYTVFRIATTDVDANYLIRFLKSPIALSQYKRLGKGSVERRKSISFDRLKSLKIPALSILEQRLIVESLDKAENIREKRFKAIETINDLTQAIFLEMFGDPIENDRNWEIKAVSDFVSHFESGKSIVANDLDCESNFRVLKVSAVTSGKFKPSESKPLPPDYIPPTKHLVRNGDLLFSRANTSELIGATAYVSTTPENLALPDKIWRFVWHSVPRAHPLYVCQLFRQPKFRQEISNRATGTSGSMKNISQDKVMTIRVGNPDYELQLEFAKRVSAITKIDNSFEMQKLTLDECFGAFQQRAFADELMKFGPER